MNDQDVLHVTESHPAWFRSIEDSPTEHFVTTSQHAFNEQSGIGRILVINLNRQASRWTSFVNEARSHSCGAGRTLFDLCQRLEAVDGRTTPLDSYASHEVNGQYTLQDFYTVDPQPLLSSLQNRTGIAIHASPQELAVAKSHVIAWRQIAEIGITTLVVEDDVEFTRFFHQKLNRVWNDLADQSQTCGGFDLLYLSYRPVDSGIRRDSCTESLHRIHSGLWWLSGYVLTPSGAAKLLEALPVCGPVDQWINHQFEKLRVYASSFPLISQRKAHSSDNSYSIIPILRAIRGSMAVARSKQPFPASDSSRDAPISSGNVRRRVPVFAIGLNKTGTTSLHQALELLGYRSCHWQSDDFSEKTARLIENGDALEFEAYTDVASIGERFEQLDRQYPDAAFILTTRPLNEWLASRARHVALNRTDNETLHAQRYSWTVIDPVGWRNERIAHHEKVMRHFQGRPDKLLVLDICSGEGWPELCSFLHCPVPQQPFPQTDPLAARRDKTANPSTARTTTRSVHSLQHDDFPWIVKPSRRMRTVTEDIESGKIALNNDAFVPVVIEDFARWDGARWRCLNDTFETNLSVFREHNVALTADGITFKLQRETCLDRAFTAGAITSLMGSSGLFHYGRFEAEIKPALADGVLTGMFLHRRDPWQEIDLEFLGAQPGKMLVNVYFNPGEEGDHYNFGMRGTPFLVDLGFDATRDFHHYAIEWDPFGIRWFVDHEVVFARSDCPTPVPYLPMKFYLNTWPIDAEELAGRVDDTQLPVTTHIRSIAIKEWSPSPQKWNENS